jgi:hypothetical protein
VRDGLGLLVVRRVSRRPNGFGWLCTTLPAYVKIDLKIIDRESQISVSPKCNNLFSAVNVGTFLGMHDQTMEQGNRTSGTGPYVLALLAVDDFGTDAKKSFFSVGSFNLLQQ